MSPSPEVITRIWSLSLIVFAIVLVVVAILLFLILREAKRIRGGASEIWNVGQKIANNTIHIALLDVTNHVAGRILKSAAVVVGATAGLKSHAESCPGCPHCLIGSSAR